MTTAMRRRSPKSPPDRPCRSSQSNPKNNSTSRHYTARERLVVGQDAPDQSGPWLSDGTRHPCRYRPSRIPERTDEVDGEGHCRSVAPDRLDAVRHGIRAVPFPSARDSVWRGLVRRGAGATAVRRAEMGTAPSFKITWLATRCGRASREPSPMSAPCVRLWGLTLRGLA